MEIATIRKYKEKEKAPLKEVLQRFYFTFVLFSQNNLNGHAAAVGFNFLLSIAPIILLIFVVLVRFLNASPEVFKTIYEIIPEINNYISIDTIYSEILAVRRIGFFEIILGLSIFWTARRFFQSVQVGLNIIFRAKASRTVLLTYIISLIFEVAVIILAAALAVLYVALREFFMSSFAVSFFSVEFIDVSLRILRFFPVFLLLVFCGVFYKTVPGKKPGLKIIILSSVLCSLGYWLVNLLFNSIVNMTKYNLMYGFLSNLIVSLLLVYFFFVLFLFFAQFIYVNLYFDNLVLNQVYLLPQKIKSQGLAGRFYHYLFFEPYSLYRRYAVFFDSGEVIYTAGEKPEYIYYLFFGVAAETHNEPSESRVYVKGDIFGDFDCAIGIGYRYPVRAVSDVVVLKIPDSVFIDLTLDNIEVCRKLLNSMAEVIRKNTFIREDFKDESSF